MSSDRPVLDIPAGSEWRFELEEGEAIAVKAVTNDPIYINSDELPPARWYPLYPPLKSSIFAPTNSRLEVSQLPASQYQSSSTTHSSLLSLHLALERIRILAKRHLASSVNGSGAPPTAGDGEAITRGPRVMVVGPPCSGKTTVVKSLVNMALKTGMGWAPGVVGLDPDSPANLIPGTLSLSLPSQSLPTHHPAHPFGSPPASAPSATLSADIPTLGWWYGHLEPATKSMDIWMRLVQSMGDRWTERCAKDANVAASGLFIDTSSAFTNIALGRRKDDPSARYPLLQQAVEAFEGLLYTSHARLPADSCAVDTVLVIGHEKLTIDLTRLLQPLSVRVLRIPQSGGVVDLDDSARQLVQAFQVRSYFYGEPAIPQTLLELPGKVVGMGRTLNPYSMQIGFDVLTVLRVGEENAAPSSALPLGSSRILSPTRLARVNPSGAAHTVRLLNTVLALVAIDPEDRIGGKDKDKAEVKAETTDPETATADTGKAGEAAEVKAEGEGGEAGEEGEVKPDPDAEEEEDEEEEVPFREEIGWREVLGFIVITGIDTQRRKYTILSPTPEKMLPSRVALAGAIEWVDST